MSMVVILLGPPGVGKGTQAVRLADSIGGEHVSTGDLLRAARREGTELGQKAQEFMDAGELVPDALILDLVREHLKGVAPEASILFDGFPRTSAQADGLGNVLKDVGRAVDRVVLFTAADEVLVKRLSGRRSCMECGAVFNTFLNDSEVDGVCDRCDGVLIQRIDDEAETVTRRLEVYQAETAPLTAHYEAHDAEMRRVEADQPVEDVYEQFRSALGLD
ncbi:MAG: adenylate kinase [Gemmatimonadales bacterium]|jgi:adenylate kinase|nr:adenylate kinase [Gemmatimonadales bacterium]MDG2240340.1 adenylate kinase [Longimicrobiales bacterium]MBT3772926.1 adenylate kinase [Gemmatimonadales bacterium]MBT3957101.1 adenylate kinase [Gemmatimonadales bacterium]MBT4186673.1 adenylate kinase [Gemmatimonadales bacterium]